MTAGQPGLRCVTPSHRGRRCERGECTGKHFRGGLCLTHWQERKDAARCTVGRCGKHTYRRDMCQRHYHRWKVWGDPLKIGGFGARIEGQPRTCDIRGCKEPHEARGWCLKHYTRWRTHGDPLKTVRTVARKRRTKAQHSPELIATVLRLRAEGLSFAEVGAQVGIGKNAANGIYRRSKVHA